MCGGVVKYCYTPVHGIRQSYYRRPHLPITEPVPRFPPCNELTPNQDLACQRIRHPAIHDTPTIAEQQYWEDIESTNALILNARASESRRRMNERSMLSGRPSGGLVHIQNQVIYNLIISWKQDENQYSINVKE